GSNLGYLEPNVIAWDEIDSEKGAKWNHFCYGAIPNNGFFYNFSRSDSAYVIYDIYCLTCARGYNRMYIRNSLRKKLVPEIEYCVKFYVNIGNNSTYGIDGVAAYFGGDELDTISRAHKPLTYLLPQVKNPKFQMITDTLGWTLI